VALLDEIAAHFDPRRRVALFEAIERIGGQAFLTGADPAVFAELESRAEMFEVSAETGVRPRS
jgi:DNA replication and repair protein RecF